MKILVISLLRLGDLIQQGALLKGLRTQYPEAEIHLLLNRQFAQSVELLGSLVDRSFYFDRDGIQKGLGEAEYNILWSYTQVENLVQQLNSENYDKVFNFTHNRLSAYLMGALIAREKKGLYFSQGSFQGLSNRWLRFFNDRFSGERPSLFHYVEILSKAFGLPLASRPKSGAVTKRRKIILFQCLTSDTKKNWGLDNFQQLKKTIEISLVDYKVAVLGAPFEKETLLKVFSEQDLLICDLGEARGHLEQASLLVSGDTSIKHLAAQVGTPIVEIAVGSSDFTKTAAFSNEAVVLSSTIPCAPCSHSSKCPQSRHLCAEEITVEKVFEAVWNQLSGEKIHAVNTERSRERAVWSLYLDKFSAGVDISAQELKGSLTTWSTKGSLYRQWLTRIKTAMPDRAGLAAKKTMQSSDVAELILVAQEILKSQQDPFGYFQPFLEALLGRFVLPVQVYDRVAAAVAEIDELLVVRETFSRHLQTHSMEGDYYAKGIGHLSVSGFAETGKGVSGNFENSGLQSRSREDAAP